MLLAIGKQSDYHNDIEYENHKRDTMVIWVQKEDLNVKIKLSIDHFGFFHCWA